MSKTVNAILVVAIVGLAGLMYYQLDSADNFTEAKAITIAEDYLMGTPTFSFDGMEESIEVTNIQTLRTPNTWEVEVKFTSRNGGFGDRTEMMVMTVLTDHVTLIVVSEGEIITAITDDVFDELKGELITQTDSELGIAKDLALDYIGNSPTYVFDGVEGSLRIIDVAIAESFPVQYFITIEFQCSHAGYGDRTDEVLAQVITPHDARVVVVNGEVTNGVIDGIWGIREQKEVSSLEPASLDIVVASVLDYIKAYYPVMSDVEVPEDWTVSTPNPEGMMGFTEINYTSGDWDVKLSGPEMQEPTYFIEVWYGGPENFEWVGVREPDGTIIEGSN